MEKYDARIPVCMRALANPTRLDIFLKILEKCDCEVDAGEGGEGNCVTQIGVELEIPQPTVSNHVKELVNCGLVRSERRGKRVFLFVNEEIVETLAGFLSDTLKAAKVSRKTCSTLPSR